MHSASRGSSRAKVVTFPEELLPPAPFAAARGKRSFVRRPRSQFEEPPEDQEMPAQDSFLTSAEPLPSPRSQQPEEREALSDVLRSQFEEPPEDQEMPAQDSFLTVDQCKEILQEESLTILQQAFRAYDAQEEITNLAILQNEEFRNWNEVRLATIYDTIVDSHTDSFLIPTFENPRFGDEALTREEILTRSLIECWKEKLTENNSGALLNAAVKKYKERGRGVEKPESSPKPTDSEVTSQKSWCPSCTVS